MDRRNFLTVAAAGAISIAVGFGITACVPKGGSDFSPRQATKDSQFVNGLGMRFVPVPGTKILMCTTEITVAQFQALGMSYEAPEFQQEPYHPAVNVSQHDAMAWCKKLSKRERMSYRLPTNAEWDAAVGTATYPWGEQWPPPNNIGNFAGQEMRTCTPEELAYIKKGFTVISRFTDRHKFTAPVGSYPANDLGIYDLGGNVSEWCGESAVARGGSWAEYDFDKLRSSSHESFSPGLRSKLIGFRCVME